MTRAWRIEYEGALYHVLSRGNERGPIVFDDRDRKMFVDCIGQMAERFEIDVFAYVLMDNHYHLLFRTPRANLSKCMHWFGVTYTNRFNSRHDRSGHLFQGRFKNADAVLFKAAKILNCDPRHYRKALRISAADKVNRDLLIYLLWHTGRLTNQQIGEKFGLTYSAVSRRVRIFQGLLKNNRKLKGKFNQIKSIIKI